MGNSRFKFRAWDEIEKKMWTPIVAPDGVLMVSNQIGGYVSFDDPQDPLMQFTGLQDKNGVDIYEGDVVKLCIIGTWIVKWHEHNKRVMFVSHGMKYIDTLEVKNTCEVIGNIHESPELLT